METLNTARKNKTLVKSCGCNSSFIYHNFKGLISLSTWYILSWGIAARLSLQSIMYVIVIGRLKNWITLELRSFRWQLKWPTFDFTVSGQILWSQRLHHFQPMFINLSGWLGSYFIEVMIGPFLVRVMALWNSGQILWPQFLLQFSTDFCQTFRLYCHYMTMRIFYWGHNLAFNTRVLCYSCQILWLQLLLQLSADLIQTFSMLMPFTWRGSYFIWAMIRSFLPELLPFASLVKFCGCNSFSFQPMFIKLSGHYNYQPTLCILNFRHSLDPLF